MTNPDANDALRFYMRARCNKRHAARLVGAGTFLNTSR
jgi:hypothetical protein